MNIQTLSARRTLLSIFLIFFSALLIASYSIFLQESNEYMGYHIIDLNLLYFLGPAISIISGTLLIPIKIIKPSDFFILFYGLLIIVPYGILFSIMGQVKYIDFLLNITILLIPAIIIKLTTNNQYQLNLPELFSSKKIINGIVVIAIFVSVYVIYNSPFTAGFDIETSYIRRLEAREIFTASSLGAYASSITLNGLLPIIAFFSGAEKRKTLVIISLICAILFFYAIGIKAQFLMIGLGYILGRNARLNQLPNMQRQVYLMIVFIFSIFFIEYLFSGYSYMADYIIRRIFTMPTFVMSGYFDLIYDPSQAWSPWIGIDYSRGVTYLVGEKYFNDSEANANTNTFIFQLASGGIPMYIVTIALVNLFYLFVDSLYLAKKNSIFMYLGFIYAVLLIEQNATTALLSSGVGLMLLIFTLGQNSGCKKLYVKI